MVKRGILVQPIGDFAHRIRVLGNDATHRDLDLEELTELRLFTSLFLQYAFTLPNMIPVEPKTEQYFRDCWNNRTESEGKA